MLGRGGEVAPHLQRRVADGREPWVVRRAVQGPAEHPERREQHAERFAHDGVAEVEEAQATVHREHVVLVQVAVVERERQPEGEHLVGPPLDVGQHTAQCGRGVVVEAAAVTRWQGGVLLDPGRHVRRRLSRAEPGAARPLQVVDVPHQLALQQRSLARDRDPRLQVVADGLAEDRALVRGQQETPLRVDRGDGDDALRQCRRAPAAGSPRRPGPGSSAWRSRRRRRSAPARRPTSTGPCATPGSPRRRAPWHTTAPSRPRTPPSSRPVTWVFRARAAATGPGQVSRRCISCSRSTGR